LCEKQENGKKFVIGDKKIFSKFSKLHPLKNWKKQLASTGCFKIPIFPNGLVGG
jgi:hypothetical protein